MKKQVLVLLTVLLWLVLFTVPVAATQPAYGWGTWDNFNPLDPAQVTYDVHGPFEGLVTQPSTPGRSQEAFFEGMVDGRHGTCRLNVVTIGKKGVGSGAVLQCDGELSGLHATFRIYLDDPVGFTGSYEAWFHFDP